MGRNILAELKKNKQIMEKYFLPKNIKAGEFLFRENERGYSLFFLENGRISIRKSMGAGDAKVLAFVGKGDFFGEISVIEETARTASAVAETDCLVYEISKEGFYDLTEKYPKEGFALFSAIISVSLCRLQHTSKELTLLYDISKLLTKSYSEEKEFLSDIVNEVAFYFEDNWNIESFFYNFYNDEYEKVNSSKEFESNKTFKMPSENGWLNENTYAIVYSEKGKIQAYMIFEAHSAVSEDERDNWSVIFNTISFILSAGLKNIAVIKENALMNKLKDRKNSL